MEKFVKRYRSTPMSWPHGVAWEIVGVVGSGNLEALVEPHDRAEEVRYVVVTTVHGFRQSWEAALKDFAHHHAIGGTTITIHDQGAVPAVVLLRLRQVVDRLVRRSGAL